MPSTKPKKTKKQKKPEPLNSKFKLKDYVTIVPPKAGNISLLITGTNFETANRRQGLIGEVSEVIAKNPKSKKMLNRLFTTYRLKEIEEIIPEEWLRKADTFKVGDKAFITKPRFRKRISDWSFWHDTHLNSLVGREVEIISKFVNEKKGTLFIKLGYTVELTDDKDHPVISRICFLPSWLSKINPNEKEKEVSIKNGTKVGDKVVWRKNLQNKKKFIEAFGEGPFIVCAVHVEGNERKLFVLSKQEENCGFWKPTSFFKKAKKYYEKSNS